MVSNGGSTIVAPDGTLMIDPVLNEEALIIAEIDAGIVRGERQNLDQAGHYPRPDVLRLKVIRKRQAQAKFQDYYSNEVTEAAVQTHCSIGDTGL